MANLNDEIRVRISKADKKALEKIADSKGLGLSTWARQLLITEKNKNG